MKHFILLAVVFLLVNHRVDAQIITTIAGTDTAGYNGDNIPATVAQLSGPLFVTSDLSGNIYFTDHHNNRIRKISAGGIITTVAGTGAMGYNGEYIPATAAALSKPAGIAIDNTGNIFFADDFGNRIRKIDVAGMISTIAGTGVQGYSGDGGAATDAQIFGPHGLVADGSGNIYFGDFGNNRVRKIDSSGIITTIAGGGIVTGDNGPATAAEVKEPYGLAFDGVGNLYIAEWGRYRVRKVNTAGMITTIAGAGTLGFSGDGGSATAAKFNGVAGVAVDGSGAVYISDAYNNRIRKIAPDGIINTVVGNGTAGFSGDGGNAINAELKGPIGMAFDYIGNLYIAELGNSRIRRVSATVFVPEADRKRAWMNLYPNPSSGRLTINISSDFDELLTLRVANMVGQTVKEINLATNSPENIQLELCPGEYFMSVMTSKGLISNKLVISTGLY